MIEPRVIDARNAAQHNTAFRSVLYTGKRSQLVMMALAPGEEIGSETHAEVDQLLYLVTGEGVAVLGDVTQPCPKGAVFCVPAGTTHNLINTGDQPLKLLTVYSPPQHAPGTVHATKADADTAERASEERTRPLLTPA